MLIEYFRKYALFLFLFLAVVVQLRAPFIPMSLAQMAFYGFFFVSAIFIFLHIITRPAIFLHPAFRLLLILWLVYLFHMLLFDHSFNGIAYVVLKGVTFATIAICVYYYYDFYKEWLPYFLGILFLVILVLGLIVHPNLGGRYQGILNNPNTLGYISSIAFGIFVLTKSFNWRTLLVLIFLLAMVFVSGSRAALLGVGIALILRDTSWKNILLVTFFVILALIVNVIAAKFGFMTGLSRVTGGDDVLSGRELTNIYGFKTVMLSPYYGWGLDKYTFITPKVIPEQLKYVLVPNPHNSHLALFIQLGIPLGIFVEILLFYYVFKLLFTHPLYKPIYFILVFTFIASFFESFLFGISGFEGIVFWSFISLYLMYMYHFKQ